MGDFDYGMEHGLWDADGIPHWLGDEEEQIKDDDYHHKKNTTLNSIEIHLTPSKYLDSEGRYLRAKLINNELSSSDIKLEVMHDKYNNNDSFALEVYNKGVMIGHIQKYSSLIDINDFCFIGSKKIGNLVLSWKSDKFYLSRTLLHSEENRIQRIKEDKDKEADIRRLEERKQQKSQKENDERDKQNRIKYFKDEIEKEKLKLNYGGMFGFAKKAMAQLTIDTHYSNIRRLEGMGYGYYQRTR